MTAPSWMKPEGTSAVRASQIDRDWERRASDRYRGSGRDAQRLGPEGIERGDGRSPAGALMPANDQHTDHTLFLIDWIATPSDKGDEG